MVSDADNTPSGNVNFPGMFGLCIGYLQGFDEMHSRMAYVLSDFSNNENKIKSFMWYCKPETVTYEQEARIVVKYLTENPDKLHYPAGDELVIILQKYFPCDKSDIKFESKS